jgi:hypothetical protein
MLDCFLDEYAPIKAFIAIQKATDFCAQPGGIEARCPNPIKLSIKIETFINIKIQKLKHEEK